MPCSRATYSVYSNIFNAIRHYSAAKMAHTERDTFTFFPHSTSCDEGITGHSVTGPFRPNIHGIRPGHIQGEPPFNHIQPYSCSVHTRTFLLVAFLYILTHSSLNASGWPSSEWSTLVNSVYVVAGECDLSFTLHAVAFTSILHQAHSSPFVNATYAVLRSHSHTCGVATHSPRLIHSP